MELKEYKDRGEQSRAEHRKIGLAYQITPTLCQPHVTLELKEKKNRGEQSRAGQSRAEGRKIGLAYQIT